MNQTENITEITLEEFRKELFVNNKTVNNYNNTFDLNWGSKLNIKDYNYNGFREVNNYKKTLIK